MTGANYVHDLLSQIPHGSQWGTQNLDWNLSLVGWKHWGVFERQIQTLSCPQKSILYLHRILWQAKLPVRLDGLPRVIVLCFPGGECSWQPAWLWAENMACCCRKAKDVGSQIPSLWAKTSPGNHTSYPHPSHALQKQLIAQYVAITHHLHYITVAFFLLNKLLFGCWGRKLDWGLICVWHYHLLLPAHQLKSRARYFEAGLVI